MQHHACNIQKQSDHHSAPKYFCCHQHAVHTTTLTNCSHMCASSHVAVALVHMLYHAVSSYDSTPSQMPAYYEALLMIRPNKHIMLAQHFMPEKRTYTTQRTAVKRTKDIYNSTHRGEEWIRGAVVLAQSTESGNRTYVLCFHTAAGSAGIGIPLRASPPQEAAVAQHLRCSP
jgi:hypothetical protein